MNLQLNEETLGGAGGIISSRTVDIGRITILVVLWNRQRGKGPSCAAEDIENGDREHELRIGFVELLLSLRQDIVQYVKRALKSETSSWLVFYGALQSPSSQEHVCLLTQIERLPLALGIHARTACFVTVLAPR